jgi:hypothetical protein
MDKDDKLTIYSADFIQKLEELGKRILEREQSNSRRKTPKSRVRMKGQYQTVEEDYLRAELSRAFQGLWTYIPISQETIMMKTCHDNVQYETPYAEKTLGYLEIIDNGVPRRFPAPGFQLYQYRSGAPRTPDNLINPEITPRGAWSRGLAFAINRLTRIGDDVYKKTATEYELKGELQQEIKRLMANCRQSDKTEIALKVQTRIDEYGEIQYLPENVANNIITYLTTQMGV